MLTFAVLSLAAAILLRLLSRSVRTDARFGASGLRVGALSNVLFAVAAVLALTSGFVIIPAGHVGVQVLFGKVKPAPLTEGISLINPRSEEHTSELQSH